MVLRTHCRLLLILAAFCIFPHRALSEGQKSILVQWNKAVLDAARDSKLGAPVAARALAIVHTCIYDGWGAYDSHALGTLLQAALRRPPAERTLANKERAASYAAFRALSDLLPAGKDSIYIPLMKHLGYDPSDNSMDIETPTGIGNVACAAVLENRHHDKSNQLGDLAQGAYSDWSRYSAVNPPGTVPVRFPFVKPLNPNRWQPLTYTDSTGNLVLQMFAGAQWCYVTPFALSKGDELRNALDSAPAQFGTPEYQEQARVLIDLSANLTDHQKMIAESWANGSDTEMSTDHWMRFAEFVSERDHHTLDDDVKMFFALSNAMLDADIAAWDAKRAYDSVRSVTAISFLFHDKQIRAWGGPGKGTIEMDGSQWVPYQPATSPTPPSPEYVSEQSTSSAAAAEILKLWTGSDAFGKSVTLAPGTSQIEPGLTPAKPVVLQWVTFTDAANEAGVSTLYGGIHFARADMAGRHLGRLVADKVWAKAQTYFNGPVTPLPSN